MSKVKPGWASRSQNQGEPGGATSQAEATGARSTQVEPGGGRKSQESMGEPGETK